ncbi:hypothetical protein ACFV6E_28750 [Streptomyces sp. NPDC059785]
MLVNRVPPSADAEGGPLSAHVPPTAAESNAAGSRLPVGRNRQ